MPNSNPADEPELSQDEIDAKADKLVQIASTLAVDYRIYFRTDSRVENI